jgi:D-sedoheptulose 7-phosphate isomerase
MGGAAAVMITACHAMAERFHRGGKLLVLGSAGCAGDAARITVDFLRPIGAGRRGLPAVAFGRDAARCLSKLSQLAEPDDMVLVISSDGRCPDLAAALELARSLRLVTVALVGGDGGDVAALALADHVLVARSGDPAVVKDLHGTMYHALWELVHVLLEQPGLFDSAVVP